MDRPCRGAAAASRALSPGTLLQVATDIAPRPPAVAEWRPGTPPAERADHRSGRDRSSVWELVVGALLTAMVAGGGVYLSGRPSAGALDRWVLDQVPNSDNQFLTRITVLRYPAVIVVGAVVLALLTARRDWTRALGCMLGPPAALLTGELVVKPAVGRTLGGLLSYPSGTTVGAAALATAIVLAAPTRWRAPAIVVASVYTVWMAVAVVALRWHFPTDVLAGMAYGVGLVLLVDGGVWWAARGLGLTGGRQRRRADPEEAGSPGV
jgi:membrane-associated phospholipid phosphatase